MCPQCGNLKAVCSSPEGLAGEGYHATRDVCWITAAREVATRKWRNAHGRAQPDSAGYLPTDGVMLWAALEEIEPDPYLDQVLAETPSVMD